MASLLVKNGVKPISFVTQFFAALVLLLAGLASQAASADTDALPRVTVDTNHGEFELTLRPDVAPETVANFLAYVDEGFYDDTIFHRVIPGFMVQGGGFNDMMRQKPTRSAIRNEGSPTVKNLRGSIAMARTNNPHSATSQFFINLVDNPHLNASGRGAGYAVFGKVTSGMGVIDSIAQVATGQQAGHANVPVQPVRILTVRRVAADTE
ncbi:MAG: peptidylprolyl isomerase [Marinobacter sp.]|nr:peptidylprolyl isomerase [Marinobacter sp.]